MVPSITDWLHKLLTRGVSTFLVDCARDIQMGRIKMSFCPVDETDPTPASRLFAAHGDQLLPLDGAQTFPEAVMRSGMTDAQKVEWLYSACLEYEQRYGLGVTKVQEAAEEAEPVTMPTSCQQ